MNLISVLKSLSNGSVLILDTSIKQEEYCTIDLSSENPELLTIAISNPNLCQTYIDQVLEKNKAKVAFGGYLEKRNLYTSSSRFSEGKDRNIHLGMDFWCAAGTKVITPIAGKVHSFKNNNDSGNYGPTIILEHTAETISFYTLYGHLSLESLKGLYRGKEFSKGETLATLGTPDINVNYAPHLHFQIIQVIGEFKGDYPGVCNKNDLSFYKDNCPDPNLLFKL
ncbi:peptidoglycan DD-metalloendopeptidase family protein [uncultured Croceitalea sp.]|uniref:peptidoglycan DD-metalloendopeptidase family protein n=1 Tax=uncultured Croceitalea sp. TaxID=1798908 RepID=UPI0033057F41